MNITYLSCTHATSGIGRYTYELAAWSARAGHTVELLRKDPGAEPWITAYPYRSFRGLKHYVAPYFLRRALPSSRGGVFHADYADAGAAWTPRPGARLFTTVHDAIPFHFYRQGGRYSAFYFYRSLLRAADRKSAKLITVSEHARRDLAESAGISPDRIAAIPNGINTDRFFPDPQKRVNDRFTIRFIGGLAAPHKNAAMLIEMARILEARRLPFQLEFGSGDALNTPLPGLVKKYGLRSVRFAGLIPDHRLRDFLAGADLFVFPSLYEGFGFPPLEAMACGTATLSSDRSCLPEILGDGALLAPPDPEAFAHQVMRVMESPALKKQLEQAGAERAGRYTWDETARQTFNLYHQAS